ncbi:pilus assembly protein PilZ [Massilia sp. Root133]|uniref:Flagellar brake protein n=2 Tax=Telluria group TaxID=2895353 RepID=A0A7X3G3B4_9BURK|nr:pilus assembly protein PilZ [Massilia sp. Root133]KQZ35084.1 pilus assembly protein PilZ [Massilia sp. Root1485]MVW62843.1 flagellar brake protein [Telluria cellulosilytica]
MRDPFDIGDALTTLALTGEPVTVYPRGQDFVMARIDSVDPEHKVFTLELAGNDVLAEGEAVFVAALGSNAKIQFELDADWAIVEGRPDLVQLPLPEVCLVLNRRAEPRLESPVGMNYGARFTLLGKVFEMPLYDFSRGGVGLRATPEQALELYVGKKLEGVQLELGTSLAVSADLEIRLLRPFRTFLLGQQVQVGCRISNISMQMRQTLERAVVKVQKRR